MRVQLRGLLLVSALIVLACSCAHALTVTQHGGFRRQSPSVHASTNAVFVASPFEKAVGRVVSVIQNTLDALAAAYRQLIVEPLLEFILRGDGDPDAADRAHQHDRPNPIPPAWEELVLPTGPAPKDLVVPNWKYESLKDAVESARNGERVYARSGDHHWDGKITIKGKATPRDIPRDFHVIGEGETRLWGRWSVSRYSQGSFKGVMCAYETEGVGWPCVIIRGDPWLFDSCQLRSAGAYAVMCAKMARVTIRRCGVGGMGGGARRAINAVIVMDSSWCLLQQCQIEDTDYAHPAVRLMENARGGLENCTVQRNGYGVAVDNNARVLVQGCTLVDSDHAAFYAGYEAANAEMQIKQCTVYGRVWHTNDRPGKLSECDNRFTVSSMAMSIPDMTQAGRPEDPDLTADLSWQYSRFAKEPEPKAPFSRGRSFADLREMEGGDARRPDISAHAVRSPSALGAPSVGLGGMGGVGGGARRHSGIARRHSSAELLGVAEGLQDDPSLPARSSSANA